MDPLVASLKVAASGLEAQSTRIRIVSENLANARSTGDTPGADPFRRKTVTFAAELDRDSKRLKVPRRDRIEEAPGDIAVFQLDAGNADMAIPTPAGKQSRRVGSC